MDRRRLLQGGILLGANSAFGNPLLRFMEVIAKDTLRVANAEAIGNSGTKNYLNIGLLGAPARYTFDAWLRTNDSDPSLIFNPMTGTRLTSSNGRVSGSEYATFNYKGLNVPHLFSQSVNISSGSVPLTQFLDQFLVVRGYGTGVDGHPQNFNLQMRPLAGQPSLGGLVADGSTKVFEALQYPGRGDYNGYTSAKNIALNTLFSGRPVHELVDGITSTARTRTIATPYEEAVSEVKSKFQAATTSDTSASKLARKSLGNALALIKSGVGDLEAYWNEAVPRYRSIIQNAVRTTNLPGINDAAIFAENDAQMKRRYHLAMYGVPDADLVPASDLDLRTIVANSDINSYAENLALAEYVYSRGFVSTLEIGPGMINGLFWKAASGTIYKDREAVMDMHLTGAYMTTFITSLYFRGIIAGVLELRSKLSNVMTADGSSVWSNTAVHFSSDFNRAAQMSGNGSDHGYNQMITSVFSGAFTSGPEVVGNVLQNNEISGYEGSQGRAAAIIGYNQSGAPTPSAAAATIAQLLGVTSNPWTNIAQPLVQLQNGKLATPFGRGKVIA